MLMKKSNKILVGCLALLLVMAVGYALFSETITINGTATAKGEFNITATCFKGFTDEIGVSYDSFVDSYESYVDYMVSFENLSQEESVYYKKALKITVDNNYKNESCVVNGNKVTYHADFSQPGAQRLFVVKLTNSGTIPARVEASSLFSYSSGMQGALNILDINGPVGYYHNNVNLFDSSNFEGYDEENDKMILKNNPVINPGDSTYFIVRMGWDINDTSNNQNTTFEYESNLYFEQITNE